MLNSRKGRTARRAVSGASLIALAVAGCCSPAWAAKFGPAPTPLSQMPAASQKTDQATDDQADQAKDAIVVTGRRAALQSADKRKERSETIIDSVVADEAGKLPDNSVTEVLQRVSGVSIVRFAALGDPDHFSVEGSGVQVRGLSGVASRLNGREIFSSNNGRSLLWGDVTPELFQAVDVYKASTADLIEGGTGGQIDLRTKMPFNYSFGVHAAGNAELSMGDLAKKTDYSVSGLVSGRWHTGIGDFGLLVDLATSSFSSQDGFFRMEPFQRTAIGGKDYFIPGGYDFGDDHFNRKRTGIYAAAQWAPSADLEFFGTFFQSRYKNRSWGHGSFVTSQDLALDPSSSQFDSNGGLLNTNSLFVRNETTGAPAGGVIYAGTDTGVSTSNTITRDYSSGFTWTPGGGHLSIAAAGQIVDSSARVDNFDVFGQVEFPSVFGLDLRGRLPAVIVPSSAQGAFDDLVRNQWTAAMPHDELNQGKLHAANLDLEYKFDDNSFFKSIKAGARYADRSERDLNNGYAWAALGRGWNGDPQLTFANAKPADIERYGFENFFHGGVTPPGLLYFPSVALVSKMDIAGVHASPPAGFCVNYYPCEASAGPTPTGYGGALGQRPGFILPDHQTDYSTKTTAGYLLARFGRDSGGGGIGFNGNVGVRVVRLENSSSGYFTQTATTFIRNGTSYTLASSNKVLSDGASFTRVLPSINLQVLPTPTTHLRFAYNVTMDNASFYALRAQGGLGVDTQTPQGAPPGTTPNFLRFTTSSGNPTLKPTMSNNFDLSFEWYPKSGTTFHLAAFYKRITDLPIYTSTSQPVTVFYSTPATSTTEQAQTLDVSNATKPATIKGIEIGGRTFMDMLPGLLKGFGVEANYTYIDSQNPGDQFADIYGVISHNIPVQGLSKHNFNVTLLYEKNPFSVRVAYSWRSKYLQTTTGNGTSGSYNYYPTPGAAGQFIDISLPIYGDAYGTLDAGVTIRLTKNVSFSVQGTNLTNSIARTLQGGYPGGALYVRSWFQSDRRLSTGINLAF